MLGILLMLPFISMVMVFSIPAYVHKKYITEQVKIIFVKELTFLTTFYALLLSIDIWSRSDISKKEFQHLYNLFSYLFTDKQILVGVDGISMLLILLTTLIIFLCVISIAINVELNKTLNVRYYYAFLLLIEFLLLLAFSALDILFFYIVFEAVLIPMFFLIGFWGSGFRKIKANYYFFLYTLIGSLFMLLGILTIISEANTTSYIGIVTVDYSEIKQLFIWVCFFIGFGVKIPLFPFHIWLPEAHVEASTEGSVILAALLLKLGAYGFIRFSLPLLPYANTFFTTFIYSIAIVGAIYTSLTALRQIDMKRIIAYSSVAHMSFAVLGIFSGTQVGLQGAVLLMISHGLISSSLFFLIGFLYKLHGSRLINYYGGLAAVTPIFGLFFLFFSLANAGLPGTANFPAELLIFFGITNFSLTATFFSSLIFIFSIVYSIWLYNRVCFGNLKTIYINSFYDLDIGQITILFILAFLTLVVGIYPAVILHTTAASVLIF